MGLYSLMPNPHAAGRLGIGLCHGALREIKAYCKHEKLVLQQHGKFCGGEQTILVAYNGRMAMQNAFVWMCNGML